MAWIFIIITVGRMLSSRPNLSVVEQFSNAWGDFLHGFLRELKQLQKLLTAELGLFDDAYERPFSDGLVVHRNINKDGWVVGMAQVDMTTSRAAMTDEKPGALARQGTNEFAGSDLGQFLAHAAET